ncbi:MAG: hypothetical protein A2Z35_00845 [Actinobacteria bacterium RBG_19FT_COMBO_36_27]|nr:MAG: hypothetical protein A2Z35_00845 [Actinobacteria bacterium RBG_19FT_COMBO_36_27]
MTMKVPKEEIHVKIRTDSFFIIGSIHIMAGGRIIDYINAQTNRFIPVTNAEVYPLNSQLNDDLNISGNNDVVFINVEDIKMLSSPKEKK